MCPIEEQSERRNPLTLGGKQEEEWLVCFKTKAKNGLGILTSPFSGFIASRLWECILLTPVKTFGFCDQSSNGRCKAWRSWTMISEGHGLRWLARESTADSQLLGAVAGEGMRKPSAPQIAAVTVGKSISTLSDPGCFQPGRGGVPWGWIWEIRISDCSKQCSRVWSRVYFHLMYKLWHAQCPSPTRIQTVPWTFIHSCSSTCMSK